MEDYVLKKIIWLLVVLILMSIAIILGVFYSRANRLNMEFAKEAEVCFIYGDTNVLTQLNDKELELIKALLNSKRMYKDNLSCGFSEDASIRFNKSQTFCIACDTCPIIYWKEKDRYIKLTEDEKSQLYNLLEAYGCFFPCV